MKRALLAAAVCGLLLSGCGLFASRTTMGSLPDDALVTARTDANIPGAVVVVVSERGQSLWWDGTTGGDAFTSATVVCVDSVGKVITALTVLALEQDGTLSLDDDVEIMLGRTLRDARLDSPAITVRELLMHRAGLKQRGEALAQEWPAGLRRSYENANYALLAEAIERATGVPFITVARERVLDPLGMTDTVPLDANAALPTGVEAGYDRFGKRGPWVAPPLDPGAGGWAMSARDLTRLAEGLLNPVSCPPLEGALRAIAGGESLEFGESLVRDGNVIGWMQRGGGSHEGAEIGIVRGKHPFAYAIVTNTMYAHDFFVRARLEAARAAGARWPAMGADSPPCPLDEATTLRSPIDGVEVSITPDDGAIVLEAEGESVRLEPRGNGRYTPESASPLSWAERQILAAFEPAMIPLCRDGVLVGVLWRERYYARVAAPEAADATKLVSIASPMR